MESVGRYWPSRASGLKGSHTSTKGETVEEERERNKGAQDEQDVEAHRNKAMNDESDDSTEPGRRENEEPDVEAHRFKA
jgi:hypothetical protein